MPTLPFLGAKKPLTQPNRCWDARATQSTFNTGQQPFGPKLFKGSFRSLKRVADFFKLVSIFLFFACSFLLPIDSIFPSSKVLLGTKFLGLCQALHLFDLAQGRGSPQDPCWVHALKTWPFRFTFVTPTPRPRSKQRH